MEEKLPLASPVYSFCASPSTRPVALVGPLYLLLRPSSSSSEMDQAERVPPPPPTSPCRDQSGWCLSFSFTNTWTKHSEIYFLIKISLRELEGRGMDWEYGVGCCCCSYCSVAKLCLTLWEPRNCSMPGFPVLHYLLGVCSNSCPFSRWCQPSDHLILCHPHFLLPSIFASIGVFSNESALRIRWPKYWNFSFSISPSNEYSVLISFPWSW